MKKEDILSRLCYYDKRNPDSLLEDIDYNQYRKTPCYCDNCFYGRTPMAEYILKLLEEKNNKTQPQ